MDKDGRSRPALVQALLGPEPRLVGYYCESGTPKPQSRVLILSL